MSQIETIMSSKGAMIALAIVAFLVAALLVLVIVRMLFGGRLRMPGGRARQARLGIVDAFDLDRQRQLIIVRRDNIEHLIMIGGPNDLLIESEIVRVEARDLRDGRRDKDPMMPMGDGRIPAPSPAEPRPVEQPMLPMPLPEIAEGPAADAAVAPQRAPTFPLPPRRPMPTTAAPERRPAPSAPRLPEGASRRDETAATPNGGQPPITPPAALPPEAAPAPMPVASAPQPQSAPSVAPPTTAPPRTVPPPFMKPLPPRPPMRPLQRITPQAPVSTAAPPEVAPPAKPTAPPAASPQPPKDQKPTDAIESLEEEMAKLLGRGPG